MVEGLPSGAPTLTSILQAAPSLEDGGLTGTSLHGHVMKRGFSSDPFIQTALFGMYSKYGDLESANDVFTSMDDKNRDAIAWNSIIVGNIKNNKLSEGLLHFGSMMRTGVVPTQFTYSMVLNALRRLGDHKSGQLVHARVIVADIFADLPLKNALLSMYCNCGKIEMAFRVFSRIEDPDIVSWNTMIAGFAMNGDGESAMIFFIQFRRMSSSKSKPDDYTFAAIISAIRKFPASNHGKALHAQVGKEGYARSTFVGSTLVSMYFKNGETDSAEKVFSSISSRDVILWTEMIMGYSRMSNGERAIRSFCDMTQEGHNVDDFTLSAALGACADLAALRQGEMIQSMAVKAGFEAEIFVCASLIDMYAKSGCLQNAKFIFSRVPDPDLKCWNAMIGGFCNHGRTEDALDLFEEILKQGLVPDGITFLSLLTACSHCGLVDQGKFLWSYMKNIGIQPGPKHYSCMVCLLSRAGMLEEAKQLVIESPFSEDYMELWRTLLSSCVNNRNLGEGLNAAGQVLQLDVVDNATHVLLSNLYAAKGRWDDVVEMRRKIRGRMLNEGQPGLSWVEVMDKVHVFSSGDQSHPMVEEAQAEMQRVQGNMSKTESDLMADILTSDVENEI